MLPSIGLMWMTTTHAANARSDKQAACMTTLEETIASRVTKCRVGCVSAFQALAVPHHARRSWPLQWIQRDGSTS